MGTPEFSINTLKLLIDNGHEILRVYTQPPKKAKRTQIIKTPLHIVAEELKIDVKTSNNLDNEEDYSFKDKKIDYVVVVAYGNIYLKGF